MSVGERLHVDADRRSEMRERSRIACERWELSNHRFAPHINPTSSALAQEGNEGKPLHERVEELQVSACAWAWVCACLGSSPAPRPRLVCPHHASA